jgi:hypothetical protein
MTEEEFRAARLDRLRQELEDLLPKHDPDLFGQMYRLLAPSVADGLDIMPRIRPLFAGDGIYPAQEPTLPTHDNRRAEQLGFEDLPLPRRATLWPYRPDIYPDELLSSWLWRIAAGIGAPPKRFTFDAIGMNLADVDRDVSDMSLERIAFLSGQGTARLLRATLRADVTADVFDRREKVQRLLLRHGDLILTKRAGANGRGRPVHSYCPYCLRGADPYLRRGWRFSFECFCFKDGCFLIDSCWKCGATLDPLAQTTPSDRFICNKCGVAFATAPCLRMTEAIADQSALYERLHRLAFAYSSDWVSTQALDYIQVLSKGDLRGTNQKDMGARYNAVLRELPLPGDQAPRLHRKSKRLAGDTPPAKTTARPKAVRSKKTT